MNIRTFLMPSAATMPTEDYVPSERYLDDNGQPLVWKLKAITGGEDTRIRQSATKRVPVFGKKGEYTKEVDPELYVTMLVLACVVEPNLKDIELQQAWGVNNDLELLDSLLIPGELMRLKGKVQQINGYDGRADEEIEEVKN